MQNQLLLQLLSVKNEVFFLIWYLDTWICFSENKSLS